MRCSFVPPYLLAQIARAPGLGHSLDPGVADGCQRTLAIDDVFRTQRRQSARPVAADGGWTVHSAANRTDLPGTPVRASGDAGATGDEAVDEAWQGIRATLEMFAEVYSRQSYDDAAAHVLATVHYERDYANAFWDGTQLVFGDGDGRIFDRFTKPVDVLAHEFTHAVTQHVSGLVYRSQSGALNESMSDVFAACLKQRLLGQAATEGDWLVGEGLFLPGVQARGLRDMANPGTAYDDPVLGKDPQGADMSGYVETTDDNGGVHLNSGIPNRAFHLAATAIGGSSAEGAGRIWWQALQVVPADVDFAGFAAATIEAARAAGGSSVEAVEHAWATVGVAPMADEPADVPADEPAGVPGAPSGDGTNGDGTDGTGAGDGAGEVVEVRRSGGIAGRTAVGRCDLTAEGTHADEVRALLSRVDLHASRSGRAYPDMFMYTIVVGNESITLNETELTEDLRRLTALVLEDAEGDPTV